MSPVAYCRGQLVMRLGYLLMRHLDAWPAESVVTEVGFKLGSDPDTVRAPDLAFIDQTRIPSPVPRGFWSGAPDAAIELLSPDGEPLKVGQKIEEYLANGVRAVVIVDPDWRSVAVHRPSNAPLSLTAFDDVLDLGDVVPGFTCRLGEIFN